MFEVPADEYKNLPPVGIEMHAVMQMANSAEKLYEDENSTEEQQNMFAFRAKVEGYDNGLADKNNKGPYLVCYHLIFHRDKLISNRQK